MNVLDSYTDFISSRYVSCDDVSIEYYKENIIRFLSWYVTIYGGSYKDDVNMLTYNVQEAYIKYLRGKRLFDNHPFHGSINKKLSNVTIKTYFRAVKIWIAWLYDEGIYLCRMRKLRLPKSNPDPIIPLYSFEVDLIEKVLAGDDFLSVRNQLIILMMLECGLRCKEIYSLKFGHVHLDKNAIFVVDSKNGYSRPVPICSKLREHILKYIDFFPEYNSGELFFRQSNKKDPLTYDCIKKLFSNLKKKSSIPRLHPHLLRHTFATSYILYGGELTHLSYLIGHSSINMTHHYVHLATSYRLLDADIYKIGIIYLIPK